MSDGTIAVNGPMARLANAAVRPLYSNSTRRNIKLNGNVFQKIGLALTETPAKIVGFGSLFLGFASTIWKAMSGSQPESTLGKIFSWLVPIGAYLISALSAYLGYKGHKSITEALYSLNSEASQKEILNRIVSGQLNRFKDSKWHDKKPRSLDDLILRVNEYLKLIRIEEHSIELGMENHSNDIETREVFQTNSLACLKKNNMVYGLRVSFDTKETKSVSQFTPIKLEFIAKPSSSSNESFRVLKTIDTTISTVVLSGWIEGIPNIVVSDTRRIIYGDQDNTKERIISIDKGIA